VFSCVCGVEPPVCRSTACACVPACVLSVPVLCVWTCVVPLSLHGSVALGCQGRGSATGLAPPAPSDYEQGGRTRGLHHESGPHASHGLGRMSAVKKKTGHTQRL